MTNVPAIPAPNLGITHSEMTIAKPEDILQIYWSNKVIDKEGVICDLDTTGGDHHFSKMAKYALEWITHDTRPETKKRLKALGIKRVDERTVKECVLRLRQGSSVSSLYRRIDIGKGLAYLTKSRTFNRNDILSERVNRHIVAQSTAEKISRLFKKGSLDFLETDVDGYPIWNLQRPLLNIASNGVPFMDMGIYWIGRSSYIPNNHEWITFSTNAFGSTEFTTDVCGGKSFSGYDFMYGRFNVEGREWIIHRPNSSHLSGTIGLVLVEIEPY
jgi:hypothetical protein